MLAPTGTIAFMMDCDTTGVEPDIALIKYKKLVGEGFLKIVNQTVPAALRKLGYGAEEVDEILAYLNERETIEGAPHLKPQHLPVFDCAFKPANGERSIHYMGHVRMMGAIQPFISGAISKTVNMPEAATAEEIEQVYLEGWKLGLKAIAVYRDNSKRSQPLSTGKKSGDSTADAVDSEVVERAAQAAGEGPGRSRHSPIAAGSRRSGRRSPTSSRSPATRATSRSASIPDGQPGEIFLKMAKEGSTVSGLMDSFATTVSVALQYGVPLRDLVNKFAHVRFEPSRASPATRRSRSRSRSWTTSSGGSARGSCLRTTRQRWVSSTAPRSWRTPRPPPRAPLRSSGLSRTKDRAHRPRRSLAHEATTPAAEPTPAPEADGQRRGRRRDADRHGRGRVPGRGRPE